MMKRTPYAHIALATVLFLLALGAYVSWFNHVRGKAAEASQVVQEVKTLGDAGGRSASIRRVLEDLERQEAETYGHFVSDETIVTYLEEVEATGENLGSAVEVVSVGNAPAQNGSGARLQVALRISGSFDAVMRTLGAIEYQAYDTVLSSLTLDTPPADDSGWTAAATFLIGTMPVAGAATTTQP